MMACGKLGGFASLSRMFDDLEPQKKAPKLKNLEPMSVDELMTYVNEMKDEITRAESEIARKKAYAAAASSSFFKTDKS